MKKVNGYPMMVQGGRVEVPCKDRQGRPSYRWVQGWIVHYAPCRVSTLMRYNEARSELVRARKEEK